MRANHYCSLLFVRAPPLILVCLVLLLLSQWCISTVFHAPLCLSFIMMTPNATYFVTFSLTSAFRHIFFTHFSHSYRDQSSLYVIQVPHHWNNSTYTLPRLSVNDLVLPPSLLLLPVAVSFRRISVVKESRIMCTYLRIFGMIKYTLLHSFSRSHTYALTVQTVDRS